ncbi:ABC transporter substrate-binding protein [Nocardiopsis sp. CC223A]|uniref:ABC transporter substrate-binding protein n=1 Tax=Nocardiopsis sp. CC223A TaxID=3044051 RepID=UPI00278BEFFE|nr:ABC transporter substrate-binding protein [Nocardiopsis sp. CC223A]
MAGLLAAALTGCGAAAQDDAPAPADGDGAYPITVTTSQGEVTIESAPERVVALGFSSTDELISLGVDPVKVAVDPDTLPEYAPWLIDPLTEAAADGDPASVADPSLLAADGSPDLEAIATAAPDLIIAEVYQVPDRAAFERLNAIAPTITPDTDAFNPDWDERLLATAAALDRTEQAQELITELEAEFTDIGAEVPGIEDRTYQWVRADDNGYTFGNGSLFELFGMRPADNQDNTQTGAALSLENTAELDADLLAVWAQTGERQAELEADPLFRELPSVRNGTVYFAGLDFANAINSPAPISLRWLRDELAPVVGSLA